MNIDSLAAQVTLATDAAVSLLARHPEIPIAALHCSGAGRSPRAIIRIGATGADAIAAVGSLARLLDTEPVATTVTGPAYEAVGIWHGVVISVIAWLSRDDIATVLTTDAAA